MFTLAKSTTGNSCGSYFLFSKKYLGAEYNSRIKIGYNVEWFQTANIEYWFVKKI